MIDEIQSYPGSDEIASSMFLCLIFTYFTSRGKALQKKCTRFFDFLIFHVIFLFFHDFFVILWFFRDFSVIFLFFRKFCVIFLFFRDFLVIFLFFESKNPPLNA